MRSAGRCAGHCAARSKTAYFSSDFARTPDPNWEGGEGWEEAVHMPSCVTYVAEEYFMFVKWTLPYLAVSIIRAPERGEQGSGGEGGRGSTGDQAR